MMYQTTKTVEAHYWDGIGGNLPEWLTEYSTNYEENTGTLDIYDPKEGGYLTVQPNKFYIVRDRAGLYKVSKGIFEHLYKAVE